MLKKQYCSCKKKRFGNKPTNQPPKHVVVSLQLKVKTTFGYNIREFSAKTAFCVTMGNNQNHIPKESTCKKDLISITGVHA